MRLLVDQDAVIAHWGPEFDRRLDTFGEDAANIPRTADQQQWDLKAGRTDAEKAIIEQIMTEPGFYSRLEPIAGAKRALKDALAAGHDVRIVSSPFISNPTCASDKLAWITKHYGSHWASRLVLTNDKTIVNGDILIDDKPEVTGSMKPSWQHVVFGDYPYNQETDTLQRICWWHDGVLSFLEELVA
jgi:5'-nucleotidase